MHPKHSTGFGFLSCAMRQTKHLTESTWSSGASCEPRAGGQFLHLLLVSSAEQGIFQKNDFQRVISSSLFTQMCSWQHTERILLWQMRWGVEGWLPSAHPQVSTQLPKATVTSPCSLQTKASLPTPLGEGEKGTIHSRTSAGSFQTESSSLIQWSITSSHSLPRFGECKWSQICSAEPPLHLRHPEQGATVSSSAPSPTPLANHGHHLTHKVIKYLQLEGC